MPTSPSGPISQIQQGMEQQSAANSFRTDLISTGLVASTTQTQVGALALASQFNFLGTVANAGDAVRLQTPSAGLRVAVFNNGVNSAKVFPPSGVDLGEGIDTELDVAAGTSVTFLAESASVYKALVSLAPNPTEFEIVSGLLQLRDNGIALAKIAGHGAAGAGFVLTKEGWIDNSGAGITIVDTTPGSPVAGRAYFIKDIDTLRVYDTVGTYWSISGTKTDGDAPTITGVEVLANGTTWEVTFDENIVQGASYADAHWTVNVTPSKTVNLTYSSISNNVMTLTGSATIYDDETVTLDHSGAANGVEDAAGNDLAAVSGVAVTNSSEQGLSGLYSENFSLIPTDTLMGSLAEWTDFTNPMKVSSAKQVVGNSDTTSGCYFSAAINSDHFIKAYVDGDFGSNRRTYMYVRYVNGNNFYRMNMRSDSSTLEIEVNDAGSLSTLTSVTITDWSADFRLRATGTGSATRLTLETDTGSGWTTLLSDYNPGSGNYIDGGSVGIGSTRNSSKFDNIVIGNL